MSSIERSMAHAGRAAPEAAHGERELAGAALARPHCPACGAAVDGAPLRRFTAAEAAQHFVLASEFPSEHALLLQHIRTLWHGDTCELHACAGCGLQFAWPFVAGDGSFYNLAYPYSDYPMERWEWAQTRDAIRRQPLSAGPVLEIGAGFGNFLKGLSPALLEPARVRAIEYNDTARARIEQRGFAAFGVDVREPQFDAWRGTLAAVFMFQVLEHMDGLDALFKRLAALLQPGGSVFIAVPNIHRIDHNEAHGSLLDMPPNHISRWTEQAFAALAQRLDWTLVEHRTQPFRWAEFMKHDLVYAHMRRAQETGSVAHLLRGRRRTPLRVAAEGALALASAPTRVPGWLAAARGSAPLGDAVWVHFRARG